MPVNTPQVTSLNDPLPKQPQDKTTPERLKRLLGLFTSDYVSTDALPVDFWKLPSSGYLGIPVLKFPIY